MARLAVTLPTFLDADGLRLVLVALLFVLLAIVFWILRVVRELTLRLVLIAVVAVLGLIVWNQRADLGECKETCSCRFLGFDVQVPESARRACGQGAPAADHPDA